MIYYIKKGEYNMAALFILAILYFIACSGRNKKRKPDRLDKIHYYTMHDIPTSGSVYIEPNMVNDRRCLDKWYIDSCNNDTITPDKIMFYVALCDIVPIPDGYDLNTPEKEIIRYTPIIYWIKNRIKYGYSYLDFSRYIYNEMSGIKQELYFTNKYIDYSWFDTKYHYYTLCIDDRNEEYITTHEELKNNLKQCIEDYNKLFNNFDADKKELINNIALNNNLNYSGMQYIFNKLNDGVAFLANKIIGIGTTFWNWL